MFVTLSYEGVVNPALQIEGDAPNTNMVSVLLSGSGHLFQCTLQLKYTKVLSSHTLIIAALYGMAWPNSLVRNFKNFKIVLSELSPNLAMILVPDFFLTRLICICKQKTSSPFLSINSSQKDRALPVRTSKPNFVTFFVYFGNSLLD